MQHDLRINGTSVTPSSFFVGIHSSHGSYSKHGTKTRYDGTPNARSEGDDEKIATAETRLGLSLPKDLKAIYRAQNGGNVNSICIPLGKSKPAYSYDEVIIPFGGYNALHPLERLQTVKDCVADWVDEEEYKDGFPDVWGKMIALARWYSQTLFLDYSKPGEPGVGIANFEYCDWQTNTESWEDFGAFFAALRHYDEQ